MTPALLGLTLAAPLCGPIDLETALALAAIRNDAVSIRRAEQEVALAEVAVANALQIVPDSRITLLLGPAPRAEGNVLSSPDSNRRPFYQVAPFGRVDLEIVQPLFTWGRLDAMSDSATAGAEARSFLVRDELARVQERIVRLFWAEALARRLLATVADVEEALSEAQRRVDQSLARSDGEVVPADRYRIALFQGLLRQRGADARRGLDLARIGLAASLSLPPEDLRLQPTELQAPAAPTASGGEARSRAEAHRSDLQALAHAIHSKEAEIRAEEAAALPQIFVGGFLSYSYAPNRTLQTNPWVSDYFNEFGAGVALGVRQDLAIPRLTARAGRARAELATLEQQHQALRAMVGAEVDSGLAEVRAADERLEAARATLSSGRSWFRAATLDFAAGLADGRDLVEAYAGYVESQAAFAQAMYAVRVALGHLDLVTGDLPVSGNPACTLH